MNNWYNYTGTNIVSINCIIIRVLIGAVQFNINNVKYLFIVSTNNLILNYQKY